jgi:integrase
MRRWNLRLDSSCSSYVFPGDGDGPFVGTSLDHQHQKVRRLLKHTKDFVIHSLRHTFLTRLGEASPDPFLLMRIAGHSSVTVSQRYVHPSAEAQERAIERLEAFNARMGSNGDAHGAVLHGPTTVSTTVATTKPVSH